MEHIRHSFDLNKIKQVEEITGEHVGQWSASSRIQYHGSQFPSLVSPSQASAGFPLGYCLANSIVSSHDLFIACMTGKAFQNVYIFFMTLAEVIPSDKVVLLSSM